MTTMNVYSKEQVDTKIEGAVPSTFTNIPVVSWSSDATYSDYGYKADIALADVTASDVAWVTFGTTEVSSGNYASFCETYNGGVRIWSSANTAIIIDNILVFGHDGDSVVLSNGNGSGGYRTVTVSHDGAVKQVSIDDTMWSLFGDRFTVKTTGGVNTLHLETYESGGDTLYDYYVLDGTPYCSLDGGTPSTTSINIICGKLTDMNAQMTKSEAWAAFTCHNITTGS